MKSLSGEDHNLGLSQSEGIVQPRTAQSPCGGDRLLQGRPLRDFIRGSRLRLGDCLGHGAEPGAVWGAGVPRGAGRGDRYPSNDETGRMFPNGGRKSFIRLEN